VFIVGSWEVLPGRDRHLLALVTLNVRLPGRLGMAIIANGSKITNINASGGILNMEKSSSQPVLSQEKTMECDRVPD
jgi:hypothetical protein